MSVCQANINSTTLSGTLPETYPKMWCEQGEKGKVYWYYSQSEHLRPSYPHSGGDDGELNYLRTRKKKPSLTHLISPDHLYSRKIML